MTGAEFKAIRVELGCTGESFARALGYGGTVQSRNAVVCRFESGEREIPDTVASLAIMYGAYGIPEGWDVDPPSRVPLRLFLSMLAEYGAPVALNAEYRRRDEAANV